jgi:NAD(P)H-hydrate epimerase
VAKLKAALKEKRFTTLALGPGLSRQPEAVKFVIGALSSLPLPAVVDADALNALAGQDADGVRALLRGRGAPCVFTPHPAEMGRCLGLSTREVQADRDGCAARLAREWAGVALLKGQRTVVSSGARSIVNQTGTPGLAKGGSGDVLTGLIAGLWAQMLASGRVDGDLPFKSAALGAHLHGLAGEAAEREKTAFAMTAGDVIESLPAAFAQLV